MAWSEERIDTLKALLGKGLSYAQIAKRLGVTRNAVGGVIHRLGLGRHDTGQAQVHGGRTSARRGGLVFKVMAETKNGKVMALRYGFSTKEAAEDHPVKLSLWSRVWVEEDRGLPETPKPTTAPVPWSFERVGNKFTYVRDAEQRRVMSLHGCEARRLHIEKLLREAGLAA